MTTKDDERRIGQLDEAARQTRMSAGKSPGLLSKELLMEQVVQAEKEALSLLDTELEKQKLKRAGLGPHK